MLLAASLLEASVASINVSNVVSAIYCQRLHRSVAGFLQSHILVHNMWISGTWSFILATGNNAMSYTVLNWKKTMPLHQHMLFSKQLSNLRRKSRAIIFSSNFVWSMSRSLMRGSFNGVGRLRTGAVSNNVLDFMDEDDALDSCRIRASASSRVNGWILDSQRRKRVSKSIMFSYLVLVMRYIIVGEVVSRYRGGGGVDVVVVIVLTVLKKFGEQNVWTNKWYLWQTWSVPTRSELDRVLGDAENHLDHVPSSMLFIIQFVTSSSHSDVASEFDATLTSFLSS